MRLSKYVFAMIVVLLLAFGQAASAIAADELRVGLWPSLRVNNFGAADLLPEVAAARLAAGEGLPVMAPSQVFGRGMTPWWGLFDVVRPVGETSDFMVISESTTQWDFRLFRLAADGRWLEVAAPRPTFAGGERHSLRLVHLEPGETARFLMRTEGPALVRFPLYLTTTSDYYVRERWFYHMAGIALGATLLVLLSTLIPGKVRPDATTILLAGMLLGNLVGSFWLTGGGSLWFPGVRSMTLDIVGFFGYALLFGLGSLHARIYLGTAQWAPASDRVLQVFAYLLLLLAVWLPFNHPEVTRIFLIWGGLGVALLLVLISARARLRGIRFSWYMLAAWATYLAFMLSIAMPRIFHLPIILHATYLTLGQVVVVAALFGLATRERLVAMMKQALLTAEQMRTERERATAMVEERSRMFAALYHDLRQPLWAVGLYAGLLRQGGTETEIDMYGKRLGFAVGEVNDLVGQIQQVSAALEPAAHLELTSVVLDEVLVPIVDEFRHAAKAKGITLRYQYSSMMVRTHVPFLQRMVRNLVSNAVRYTDKDGRIVVGYRRHGSAVLVADNGIGMSEEQLGQLFAPYTRFQTPVPIPDGMGLGLFSVRCMADALGLAVTIRSRPLRGTVLGIGRVPVAGD